MFCIYANPLTSCAEPNTLNQQGKHAYLGFEPSMHDSQLGSGPVRPHERGLQALIPPAYSGSFLGAGSMCYLLYDVQRLCRLHTCMQKSTLELQNILSPSPAANW